jgi:Heterokaryon incompatibility protein (HET)
MSDRSAKDKRDGKTSPTADPRRRADTMEDLIRAIVEPMALAASQDGTSRLLAEMFERQHNRKPTSAEIQEMAEVTVEGSDASNEMKLKHTSQVPTTETIAGILSTVLHLLDLKTQGPKAPRPMISREPLNPASKEIRVIGIVTRRIRTRLQFQYVCCVTKNVKLVDKELIAFEALSYVWGDLNDRKPILLDGQLTSVTSNLACALEQLEPEDGLFKWVWIDAISINQDDPVEKSHQVQIMKEIYSKAGLVTAWLGSPSKNGEAALKFISSSIKKLDTLIAANLTSSENPEWLARAFKSLVFDENQQSIIDKTIIDDLAERPWWRRVWILQEVQYPEKVFFRCGSVAVNRITVDRFFDLITAIAADFLTAPLDFTITAFYEMEYQNLGDMAHRYHHLTRYNLVIPSNTMEISNSRKHRSLCNLLHNTSNVGQYQATDSKDRVYALLGLASDNDKLGIVPDYTKSCEEVYTEVATAILLRGDDGINKLLSLAQAQNPHMPSWVPDWRQSIKRRGILDFAGSTDFNASGNRNIFVQRTIGGGRVDIALISIRGAKVGSVAAVFESPWPMVSPLHYESVRQYRSFLGNVRNFVYEHGFAYQNKEDLLLKLPFLDSEPSILTKEFMGSKAMGRASANALAKFSIFWQCFHQGKLVADFSHMYNTWNDLLDLRWRAFSCHAKRVIFATDDGLIGVGPDSVMPGDQVSILYGSRVPFILRQVPNINERYTLVGDAWVYRIMDGEFVEKDPLTEVFTLQ